MFERTEGLIKRVYYGFRHYINPNFRRPLPDPIRAAQWFEQMSMFGRTTAEQKMKILKVVFEEIRISRDNFKCAIEDRHVYYEAWVVLAVLELGRGPDGLRTLGFDLTADYLSDYLRTFLHNQLKYYFQREEGKSESRLKYHCHVESIRHRLLIEIFNNEL